MRFPDVFWARINNRLLFNLMIVSGLMFGCTSGPTEDISKPTPPNPLMPKIDFHAHYRADRDYLLPMLDSFNLKPVLVDVGRVDTINWHKNRSGLIANFQKNSDRYSFCTSFTANGIDDSDYSNRIIKHIQHDLAIGAKMVKVWKNFGMVSIDNSGSYVHIDDERIQPVWDFITTEGIPVLAHIGEPLQAWRPIDEDNPHAGYFKNNPQYHAYLHPEIPTWEAIQEARNNWLARNPELVVVGAHNGSMSHDVNLMAQTLDKYSNFHLEPAARFGDLIRQPSDSVRAFIIKYQDRFLYGTDLGTSGDPVQMSSDEIEQEKQNIVKTYDAHWKYFSSSGKIDYNSLWNSAPGLTALNLPDSVLQKIYYNNAVRILQGTKN